MSRQASPETELKNARAELRRLNVSWGQMIAERDRYRIRATNAEMAVVEWKNRFDALLKILPEKP